jgi:Ohr subfamily peroxiredoxin
MKKLYTSHVTVTSGRDGSAQSSDGRLSVALGWPKELGGNGAAANPEQLFAAGYAACFASSIKGAANTLKVAVAQVEIEAEATLSLREDGSYLVSHVKLTVRAEGLGDAAAAIIDEAQRICAYSNATRGNVITDIVLA